MKIIWVLILSCIATVGFSASSLSNLTKDNVPVNPSTHTATILLSSTPSTGYSWYVKSYPAELVNHVDYDYTAPSETTPGRPGTASFTFTVVDSAFSAPRLIPIVLTNARPWQPADGTNKTIWLIVSATEQ